MTPGTGPPDPDLPELEIQLSFRAGFIAFIARWWHIPEAFAKSEVQIALARKHLVSPGIHFTTGVRSKKESLSLRLREIPEILGERRKNRAFPKPFKLTYFVTLLVLVENKRNKAHIRSVKIVVSVDKKSKRRQKNSILLEF